MPILSGFNDVAYIEEARQNVLRRITERDANFPEYRPVEPWTKITKAYNYVFDLLAESFRRIRLHGHIRPRGEEDQGTSALPFR